MDVGTDYQAWKARAPPYIISLSFIFLVSVELSLPAIVLRYL